MGETDRKLLPVHFNDLFMKGKVNSYFVFRERFNLIHIALNIIISSATFFVINCTS